MGENPKKFVERLAAACDLLLSSKISSGQQILLIARKKVFSSGPICRTIWNIFGNLKKINGKVRNLDSKEKY